MPPLAVRVLWSLALLTAAFAPGVRGATKKAEEPAYRLTVTADRPQALYQRGETAEFRIGLEHRGQPVKTAKVTWTLTKDGLPLGRSGGVTLRQGEARVRGTLDEAGFLLCQVDYWTGQTKVSARAGVGYEPEQIAPSLPVPEDFTAFWAEKKAQLAAVPINARLTPVESKEDGVEVFDLQVDALGAPVSGYLARPAGAITGLPAILTVHGAGVRSAVATTPIGWAKEGWLALDINAHGLPNGRPAEFYAALVGGELKDYQRRGRESRETSYFLGMFLRLVRAIDFLASQPAWDGRTLVVYGSSQGGAQAIAAAGLDERVSFFVAGVPAMCDHTGLVVNRSSGWPKLVTRDRRGRPIAAEVEAARYYDAMNFAALTRAAGFFTVGFIDGTCPPTSVYAAYNRLAGPKEIFNDITAAHTNTPAALQRMREAVRRHHQSVVTR